MPILLTQLVVKPVLYTMTLLNAAVLAVLGYSFLVSGGFAR